MSMKCFYRIVASLLLSCLSITAAATDASAESYLYWTQVGRQPNTTDLARVPLAGGNAELLLSAPGWPTTPNGAFEGIAFDRSLGELYSTDSATFFRTDLSGGNRTNFATPNLTGIFGVVDIEIDTSSRTLYYPVDLGVRSIMLDGSNDRLVASFTPAGVPGSSGVALDLARGKLYFTTYNGAEPIKVADLDGNNVENFRDYTAATGAFDVEVDAASGILYWTRWNTDGIWAASVDGTGDIRQIVDQSGVGGGGLHFDPVSQKIFAFSRMDDSIVSFNPDGSGMETIASNVPGGVFLETYHVPEPTSYALVTTMLVCCAITNRCKRVRSRTDE